MARRPRSTSTETAIDDHERAVKWYRDELARPASTPWDSLDWTPKLIGPSWQIDKRGRWVLPQRTIGWDVLGFCSNWLDLDGEPWRFTLEQARIVLWWYALDETGRFLFDDGVLQRLKGWGKDPLGACLLFTEAIGPSRFDGWKGKGTKHPLAEMAPNPWVQTAAVSLEQTKNTMRLFPAMVPKRTQQRFRMQIGKELIHSLNDQSLIQAVTSSPATLEGARSTFVLKNETHHWNSSNDGHDMAAVVERNATKSKGGAARALAITNAFEPGEDSVAERDREAWERAAEGETLTTGIFYDSLEAPPEAELSAEHAPEVAAAIRGDSTWLDTQRIVRFILDTRNPPSRSRRFWYNQIHAAEDAWVDPLNFDARQDVRTLDPADDVVVFFDGSKSDDATGIVGCRVSDGHVFTLGMWQRPPGPRGEKWTAPREVIDVAIDDVFADFNVVAFWADPSHALDDETQDRYWTEIIDGWHRRHGVNLEPEWWAVKGKHSVEWDMTSPQRTAQFTGAAMVTAEAIDEPEGDLTWDGDPRLRRHTHNAKRRPNRYGISVGKQHRDSPHKIDLAVCMIGARMLRRHVLNTPPKAKKTKQAGKVW